MRFDFSTLLGHMGWANWRLFQAVRACPAAQADALPLLAHLVAAEHIWLRRLEGRPAELPVCPDLSLEECERHARASEAGFAALLAGRADWAEPCRYRTTSGQEYATPVADVLLHVFLHGAYHRGQVARVVGRACAQAPNTDLITFVRETGASVAGA